jgi:hypothetical protein
MSKISLSGKNGEVTGYSIIDEEDYDKVCIYKWRLSNGYAIGGPKTIKLHRFIMNAENGLMIDHINGNKLDNRKSNLRY